MVREGKLSTVAPDTKEKKLKLLGFNNLTKTLSFNIYDICYARTPEQRQAYIQYIDGKYNAERLTVILTEVANIIGAHVLNVARQDYDPQGASVTMLISEDPVKTEQLDPSCRHVREETVPAEAVAAPEAVVAHLDKSHVTVHTYPEVHPAQGISTFRADIDVATCGRISPLKALNYLIESFESDVVILDYRVRGFTRNVRGTKHFIDHDIHSIQNFISKTHIEKFDLVDVNVYQENMFHTKMRRKQFDLNDYLFGEVAEELPPREARNIQQLVNHEMLEIFYGRNMPH